MASRLRAVEQGGRKTFPQPASSRLLSFRRLRVQLWSSTVHLCANADCPRRGN